MESPQKDAHLKAMLNSPSRFRPGPPNSVPEWNVPTTPTSNNRSEQPIPLSSNMVVPTGSSNKSHANITLQNCVATIDVQCELNLKRINCCTRNCDYNPARFNGLIMRIREPKGTGIIFKSGKIICTGVRNESDAYIACKKFCRILLRLHFNVKFTNFKIQNIVATCNLHFPIKLESLLTNHAQFCQYIPENFPALVYRMVKPHLVLLIFVNGNIIFTGGKSREDIKNAFSNMYPVLMSYRKT